MMRQNGLERKWQWKKLGDNEGKWEKDKMGMRCRVGKTAAELQGSTIPDTTKIA